MLAFRSEAHVDAWCEQRGLPRGMSFPLEICWQLAQIWHGDRLSPDWRRRSPAEAQAVFDSLGLRGDFWRL
jgi:hypothetical protein